MRCAACAEADAAGLDRPFAALQRELRVEREEEDHGDERHEHGGVAQGDLARVDAVAHAVVHRADEQAQRVDARHHDAA